MKKIFLILVLAVGISIVPNFHLIAQNPINMTLVKSGPHSSHLDNVDDFLEKIILTTQEVVGKPIDFNLKITVSGPNDMNVLIEKALTEAISLNEHQALTVTGLDMEDYGLLDNISSNDINPPEEREFLETGRILREGHYIICMTAIDVEYPYEELSLPACYEYDIEYGDAPIINIPEMNDTIVALDPPVQFNVVWEHNPIGGYFNLDYNVRIIDLTAYPYSDPNELMDQPGIASLLDEDKTGVLSTFFDDIDFEINHKYGLRVTATDPDEEMVFKNGGRSNVVVFVYGDEESDEDTYTTYSNTNNCFYIAPMAITNDNATNGLEVGDILKIGSFEMKVNSISSNSGNTFAGTGEISINFLNDIKIKTEFNNIKKNSANEIFSGDVVAAKDHTFEYQKYQTNIGQAIGMEDSQLVQLNEVLDQTARLVSAYNGDASIGLPIAWDKEFGSDPVKIAILDMKFTPAGATLDALVDLDVSSLGDDNLEKIVLGVSDLAFSGGSIESEAKLFLWQDLSLPGTGGDVILGGAQNAGGDINKITYAEWDCKGFKSLNVSLDYKFPRSIAVPENDNGSDQVIAHSNLIMDDGFKWLGQIDIPSFQIVGMPDGFSFEVDEAWIDYSTTNNIDDFINNIPSNYDEDALNSNNPQIQNTWKGFWIKDLKIKLPDYFGSGSDKIKTAIHNFIYDGKYTFTFLVEDILTIEEGKSLAGSAFSIDTLSMAVIQNSFEHSSLNGKIGLPITDDFLDYSATFSTSQNNNSVVFSLQPTEDIKIPMFLANAKIESSSSFDLTVGSSTELSFDINAKIDISEKYVPDIVEDLPLSLEMPGIEIQHIKYSSKNGFNSNDFGYSPASPQKNISGFPFNLKNLSFSAQGNNLTVNIEPELTITEAGKGISAIVGLNFISLLNTENSGMKKVNLKDVEVGKVSVIGDISTLHIEGEMEFYKENDTKGTRGLLTVDLPSNIKVDLNAEFGTYKNQNKPDAEFDTEDWYDYWFLDGMVGFDGQTVYAPYIFLYGLGGGVSYHMTQVFEEQSEIPTSDSEVGASDCSYTNDYATGLGLKFKALFGSKDNGKAYNFDVTLKAEFTPKWGMSYLGLYGNLRVMAENLNDKTPPIGGYVDIEYKDVNGVSCLEGDLIITANFDDKVYGIGVIKENDLIGYTGSREHKFVDSKFHVDENSFYFNMGRYEVEDRGGLEVNLFDDIKVTFDSYLMIGDDVPPYLPPPSKAFQDIFTGGSSQYTAIGEILKTHKGSGFAFGSTFNFDISDEPFPFYWSVKLATGFDINYTHIPNRPCGNNGWYAQGQLYAAMSGNFGLEVDLWFFEGKVSIFSAKAGLILKGGLPNPIYGHGKGAISYNILRGAIKDTYYFNIAFGEKCTFVATDADLLADIEFIQDMKPADGDENVSIFSIGTASFAFGINRILEIPLDDTYTRKFKPYIESWTITKGGKEIDCWPIKFQNENNVVASLQPKFLEGETSYSQKLTVKVNEVTGITPTVVKDKNGHDWEETKIMNFKTGVAPTVIVDENVILTYPFKGQRYFLKGETINNQGYIVMKNPTEDLFPEEQANGFGIDYYARFIPVESGEIIHVDKELNIIDDRILQFDVNGLQNSTAYVLQIIRKKRGAPVPNIFRHVKVKEYYEDEKTGKRIYISDDDEEEKGNKNVVGNNKAYVKNGGLISGNNINNDPDGMKTVDESSNFEFINHNTIFIKKRKLEDITTIKKNEKKLYEYYFQTSTYNTLEEKIRNKKWHVEINEQGANFRSYVQEPFGYFDVNPYKSTIIQPEYISTDLADMDVYGENKYLLYVYYPYRQKFEDDIVLKSFHQYYKICDSSKKGWYKCSINPSMQSLPHYSDYLFLSKETEDILDDIDLDNLLNPSSGFSVPKAHKINAYVNFPSFGKLHLRTLKDLISSKVFEEHNIIPPSSYPFTCMKKNTAEIVNALINFKLYPNQAQTNILYDKVKSDLSLDELIDFNNTVFNYLHRSPEAMNFPVYANSNNRLLPISFRIIYRIPYPFTRPSDSVIENKMGSRIDIMKRF